MAVGISNAVATNNSTATANSSGMTDATANANAGATSVAVGVPLSGLQNTPLQLSGLVAEADDAASTVESVTLSGFPAGTILSTGVPNVDGTEWTVTGPLPGDLTFTTPVGFTGSFTLEVTVADGLTAESTVAVEVTIS